jgi:hypothetical protein
MTKVVFSEVIYMTKKKREVKRREISYRTPHIPDDLIT